MHLRSLIFVTQQNSTAHSVSQVTSRDNIETHHRPSKQWFTQLLLIALISLPLPGNASDPLNAKEPPQALPTATFNIPRQAADDALPVFGQQANVTVIYPFNRIKDHQTNALQGVYSVPHAVAVLLADTGLEGDFSAEGHLVITQVDLSKGKRMNITTKKSLLATMVGLFAVTGGLQQAYGQDGEAATAQGRIDEIVVTATRREVSLNDTAISVAAIGGEEIARRNLSEMNDYLRTVPGVSFIEVGVGNGTFVARSIGISPQLAGQLSNPTGGIYFGEVSLAGLGLLGGSSDLKMIDLERVEILRGPQGTLFGSGTLAGAVRNIPNAPNLSQLDGSLKTSYSNTTKNGDDNTKFEGVLNVPVIEDVLAVRAVAYRHDTSGYINNIAGTVLANNSDIFPGFPAATAVALFGGAELYQDEKDLGNATHTGGRISALWQPTEALSITLQQIYQDVEQQGQPYVELTTGGDYEQITLQFGGGEGVAGEEPEFKDETNITNLVIEYDLGWASLLSSSAWLEQDSGRNQDQSALGGFPGPQLGEGTTDVFSQELRLVSQLDGPFQYVVGVYYEEVDASTSFSTWSSTDELRDFFGSPFGSSRLLDIRSTDQSTDQLAFYGELSYDISEQVELTLGARRFDYEQGAHRIEEGILGNFDLSQMSEDSGTNLKANLSYTPSEETLLYAQWSEGFRLGNTVFPIPRSLCDLDDDGILDGTNQKITDSFDADTTENFELGAKLTLLDNQLQVNAAVYRVDWQDIPISIIGSCGFSTVGNAGEARSQGVEFETVYQLNQNLRISLGGAYSNAELTENAPGIGGVDGDRLPSSPEYSVNLGLQYEFELGGHDSYVSGDYAYVNEFFNKLGETGVKLGDYGQLNMSAGITFNDFNVELFGHNLTDENALTHADVVLADDRAYQLRPRTIGLNVGYQF